MALFLDLFFSTITIFFVAFSWIWYTLREVKTSLYLSALVALCCCYILYKVMISQRKTKNTKAVHKKRIASLSKYLCFDDKINNLFEKMLHYYGFITCSLEYGKILGTKDNQTTLFVMCFENESLSKTELRQGVIVAKAHKANKLCVFCNSVSQATVCLANEQITTQFVDIQNTFNLLERSEKLPAIPKTKQTKNAYLPSYAFSKKRFGWYLGGAIYMIVISALTFFPIYSLVWATALLALAMYSLLNKKYNVAPTCVTLQ